MDLNNILIDTDNNIENYLSQNEKTINNKDFKELYTKINNLDIKITSTRKYYNNNIEEYNKLIKKFPTSIVAKILRYKEKDCLKINKNKKLKILN
ncbi:MAG: LemA family protein [Bacilli bacterium]|nr:LemA family protein [Bacilli bacterium]